MSVATQSADRSDARRVIRGLILELAPNQSPSSVSNPHLVNDLAYHSLALLELAFTLEDEFGIPPIDQQTAQTITTVKDVEEYVVSQIEAQARRALAVPVNVQLG